MTGKCFIGCSGFSYSHWQGLFYPEDLPKSRWFSYYASNFKTVEINSSFYHLPRESTCAKWAEQAPKGFTYTLKMWRAVTHYQRLKNAKEPLNTFISHITPLKDKLGVILVQLPPSLHKDTSLLESFLSLLPRDFSFAFEFRHKSWYEDETYELLGKFGSHFVIHDYQGKPSPRIVIGRLAYTRFHGPKGDYTGSYEAEVLKDWAQFFKSKLKEGKDCFAYFNNDFQAFAPKNAQTLKKLVES